MNFEKKFYETSIPQIKKLLVAGNNLKVSTPCCLMYTKKGAFPFLTPDLVKSINHLPKIAASCFNYSLENKDTLQKFQKGLQKFCNYDMPMFLIQSDPAETPLRFSMEKGSLAVWSSAGRIACSMRLLAQCLEAAQPVAFQTPLDNESGPGHDHSGVAIGAKRCERAVARSLAYLEELQEIAQSRHPTHEDTKETTEPKNKFDWPAQFLSIPGGYFWKERERFLDALLSSPSNQQFATTETISKISTTKTTTTPTLLQSAKGYVIDGFSNALIHPLREAHADWPQLWPLFSKTVEALRRIDTTLVGRHRPIMAPQCVQQPNHIVKAVELGADLFVGAFPFHLTRAKIAWRHRAWKPKLTATEDQELQSQNEQDDFIRMDDEEAHSTQSDQPIDGDCSCFACRTHSRAYIWHLFRTDEMLAQILLMIHNSQQFYQFFHEMRSAIETNKFAEFQMFTANIHCPESLLETERDNLKRKHSLRKSSTVNSDGDTKTNSSETETKKSKNTETAS